MRNNCKHFCLFCGYKKECREDIAEDERRQRERDRSAKYQYFENQVRGLIIYHRPHRIELGARRAIDLGGLQVFRPEFMEFLLDSGYSFRYNPEKDLFVLEDARALENGRKETIL